MAQRYQGTSPSAQQQRFSNDIYQLVASNKLGNPQAVYRGGEGRVGDFVGSLICLSFGLFFAASAFFPLLSPSRHAPSSASPGLLFPAFLFLGGALLLGVSFVRSFFLSTYECSEGFVELRGKRVTLALRWDQITEAWLDRRRRAVIISFVRATNGTEYRLIRKEVLLRASYEFARREFTMHSVHMLSTFRAGQPIAFKELSVSQWGITVAQGEPTRTYPLQGLKQVTYAQDGQLTFRREHHSLLRAGYVQYSADVALLMLFLQMLSQGQIRCEYGKRVL